MIKGSCACGGIRFEIEAVRSLTHCHCTICRKLTGAGFATYGRCMLTAKHILLAGAGRHIERDELAHLGQVTQSVSGRDPSAPAKVWECLGAGSQPVVHAILCWRPNEEPSGQHY
jgi:hypothetical protein